jgi:multicomponent Na+:H+ antiporter subunit G
VIGGLLVLLVLCIWLGCAGFVRLPTALDRLHCVAFVNVTAGFLLSVAAFSADGLSARSLKILLIWGLGVLSGSVGSHVIGRAVVQRGEP